MPVVSQIQYDFMVYQRDQYANAVTGAQSQIDQATPILNVYNAVLATLTVEQPPPPSGGN